MTLGLLLMSACKPPPEAPTELNELAGFLFEHFLDEDTGQLEVGTHNLLLWLQPNLDATEEGYTVDNLSEAVIDSVNPGREHDLDHLGGASVAYVSTDKVKPIAEALTLEEQEQVFSDNYEVHDRVYETDKTCFMPKDCDFLDTDNHVKSKLPLGIEVTTHSRAQFRWIEYLDGKWALLHRTWLVDQADASVDWIQIHDQLYLGVTMPWEDGSCRLGTTWIAADILDGAVSEGMALDMMIDSMQSEGQEIDDFIATK